MEVTAGGGGQAHLIYTGGGVPRHIQNGDHSHGYNPISGS